MSERSKICDTVTREGVKRMESERPARNAELHYRIGGPVEAAVHSSVEADRHAAVLKGNRVLQGASERVQTDYVFAANTGRASAEFNSARDKARNEYIRRQRLASEKAEIRSHKATHERKVDHDH